MGSTVATVDIAAPSEPIFDLVHDYSRRLEWDPFLRRADLLGDARAAGVGVRTWCAARWNLGGLGMETEYVRFDRPGVAAVRMTRGPWFLGAFGASILQRPNETGGTRVTYKSTFRARPGWMAGVVDPVFRAVFAFETRRRLVHLKRFVESGNRGEGTAGTAVGAALPSENRDLPP